MAKIPGGQERVVFSGASIPGGRAVQQSRSPIANALRAWAANEQERTNQQALENVQQAATRAQQAANLVETATGLRPLVEAPDDTTGVFREAFEQQARAVFSADLALDARRTASRLARENPTDPDAFAQQFNAYMQGQLKPLMEADAAAGETVRLELDSLGLEVQGKLIENAAGAAQESERASLFESLRGLEVELQDEQLNAPDFASLQAGLESYEQQITNARQNNLLTATQAASEVERVRSTLTREFARGRFQEAVDAGSVGRAKGVISMLRTGGLFEDNEEGRRLADSLARELESQLGAADAVDKQRLARADATIDSVVAFEGDANTPEVQAAFDTVAAFGTPTQKEKARRIRNQLDFREQFGAQTNRAPEAVIDSNIAAIQNNPGAFPAGEGKARIEELKKRKETLRDAEASGNRMNAAEGLRLTSSLQERRRARGDISQSYGEVVVDDETGEVKIILVPLDEISHVNDDLVDAADREISEAMEIGDPRRIQEVLGQLMLTADDVHERLSIAQDAGRPQVAAFVTMATLAPDTAETLFNLTVQGSTIEGTERRLEIFNELDKIEEDIFDVAVTMSEGRSAVRDELEIGLRNAVAGLVTEFEANGRSAKDARKEFLSLIQPFMSETELDNGQKMAGGSLAVGEEKFLNEAINDRMEELLGPEVAGDAALIGSLRPVRLPDGQWGLRDTRANALVQRDGETVKLDPREAIEAAAEEALTGESSLFGKIFGTRTPTQQALELDIPQVAEAIGGDERMMKAIFKAGLKMPSDEKLDQEFSMLWSKDNAQVLNRAEFEAAWRKVNPTVQSTKIGFGDPTTPVDREPLPDPRRDPLAAKVAAALLMDQFAAKYGDGEKALAAYFVGDKVIDDAGDKWREKVPDDVFMFIGEVIENVNNPKEPAEAEEPESRSLTGGVL